MKRRLLHWMFALLAVLHVALGWHVYTAWAAAPGEEKADAGYTNMALFARALQLIRQDYVDERKADYQQLTRAALKGMLSSLDPHSQFMEPVDFKGMQEDTNSRFGGLGIHTVWRDGDLVIVTPIEGSPAARAGLQAEDQIVKIDGVGTEKMERGEAGRLLRGEPGQKVKLTVLRPSTRDLKDYELVRESITVASVKDAGLLGEGLAGDFKIGYARITQFNVPTVDELSACLDELERKEMQAFILDLRYNPGGLLESAVKVAGQFLPPKTLVVSTEGRVASQSKVYRTPESGRARPRIPMVILVNGGSASGSEIVAGALKDLRRAVILGETTFGKGSVQSVIELQDGSALRLTTAKYYTPSKQVIHEKGVAPNIRAPLSQEQERLLWMKKEEAGLGAEDRKQLAGFRDTQLERAVDVLKGLLIYGERTGRKAWLE